MLCRGPSSFEAKVTTSNDWLSLSKVYPVKSDARSWRTNFHPVCAPVQRGTLGLFPRNEKKNILLNLMRRLAVLCTSPLYTIGILKPERSSLSRGHPVSGEHDRLPSRAILFWRIGSNPFRLSTVRSFFKWQKELVNAAGRLTALHNDRLLSRSGGGRPIPRAKRSCLDRPQGSSSSQGRAAGGRTPGRVGSRAGRQQPDLGQRWLGTQHRLEPDYMVCMPANPKFKGLPFSVYPPPCWKMEIKASLGFFEDEITDAVLGTQQVLAVPGNASSFHS